MSKIWANFNIWTRNSTERKNVEGFALSENFDARVNISQSIAHLPFLVGRVSDAILFVLTVILIL
jgi:hypothetical protein